MADHQNRCTMTVGQAAELLGISRGLAYALVNRGEIPSLRLGRRIVIPHAAVDALLERAAAGVRPAAS